MSEPRPKRMKRPEAIADFWNRMDRSAGPDSCWPWRRSINPRHHYGQFLNGRAHKWAYQLAKGPVPPGLQVRHTCDNRACCNPAHLVLGTAQDNSDDMVSRGRSQKGEARPTAKLDEGSIRIIRIASQYGASAPDLAAYFGVHNAAIHQAVKRQTWKHVQ